MADKTYKVTKGLTEIFTGKAMNNLPATRSVKVKVLEINDSGNRAQESQWISRYIGDKS